MLDADTERAAAAKSLTVLRVAVDQAGTTAANLAADLTERIITDHLRPALEEVHTQAREVATALTGYGLDAHLLLAAPAKARNAYAKLPELVSRRRAIHDARNRANAIGYRTPQHDGQGFYSSFRHPLALSPDWAPPARLPSVAAPEDPIANLLWIVSDAAAPLGPWLPTVAEQDAAWWEQFGEHQQMRANAAKFARGFSPV